jgi:hypothetical protein
VPLTSSLARRLAQMSSSAPPVIVDFATRTAQSAVEDEEQRVDAYIPPQRVTSGVFIPDPRLRKKPSKTSTYIEATKSYWRVLKSSPLHHQIFVGVVVVQFFLQILGRFILLGIGLNAAGSNDSQVRNAWYFCTIVLIAVFFAMLNGLYALFRCNAYSLIVFFVTSLLLGVRYIVDYVNSQYLTVGVFQGYPNRTLAW